MITGLSGAGGTTLANALKSPIVEDGMHCCLIDGDDVRRGLNKDLDFSLAARTENVRRVAEVAKLMNEQVFIVICSLISPSISDRQLA